MLGSCVSNNRVVYLKNKSFNSKTPVKTINDPEPYRLIPTDVINIRIKTLDPDASAYYNMLSEQSVFNFNSAGLYLNSHSIASDGTIDLPSVGKVQIAGLTLEQAQTIIQETLNKQLNNATVYVKLVSFKISVLGEVTNPGYYFIYNERANILEGLALAGGLNELGNRENITLIRQTTTGHETILIDLRSAEILSSPFYHLQPNDVIYVQPMKQMQSRGNLRAASFLTVIFAGVTATILVLNYVNPN
jgi:polysaccharide export outer membrane protein